MQALSHYSYHKSGGQMVLCDLQGGILSSGRDVVLTGACFETFEPLGVEPQKHIRARRLVLC
jgi:hypothetical protein